VAIEVVRDVTGRPVGAALVPGMGAVYASAMRAVLLGSVFAICVAASACARSGAAEPSAYQRDIDRLCHAQEHSGALQLEPGHRPVAIAQWLAENLETDEVREVLVEFQRAADPAAKQAILEREAAAVGLPHCPLADVWAAASSAGSGSSGDTHH
jgi:hypothetical protein